MANEVKAVFGGDIGPLEKAVARMKGILTQQKREAEKLLTYQPSIDTAALASVRQQWQSFVRSAQAPQSAGGQYLDQLIAKLPQNAQAPRSAMQAASGTGGNARMNAGMVGAQVQDIAVQLQSGTSALTVFAQQGSQLASIFGPTGMIVGGLAAIAGATLAVGKASKDAFDKMIAGASASRAEIASLLKYGGLRDVESALTRINAQADGLALERGRTDGLGVQLGRLVGGKSSAERGAAIQDEQLKTADDMLALQKRAIELSDRELQVARLRAQGRDKEADDLNRQLALKQRLADIDAMPIGGTVKEQLKTNARSLSAVDASSAASKESEQAQAKKKAEAEALQSQLEANAEAQRRFDFDRLDSSRQLQAVHERMAQIRNLSDGKDPLADARRGAEMIELKTKEAGLQKQIADEVARAADEQQAFNDMVDAENNAIANEQAGEAAKAAEKKERQDKALQQLQQQAGIQHLRATGKGRKADKLEAAFQLEDQAQKIAEQTGLPIEDARKMAKGMKDDADALGAGRKIRGAKSPTAWGIDTKNTSSLDAFKSRQGKRLADEFAFPALDGMAKRAADNNARKAGGANKISLNEGDAIVNLLSEMLAALKA